MTTYESDARQARERMANIIKIIKAIAESETGKSSGWTYQPYNEVARRLKVD